MPYHLKATGSGTWSANWDDHDPKVRLIVSGSDDAPHPKHAATLRDLVDRWPEIHHAIRAFACALLPDGRVELQPPLDGAFAARDCGFEDHIRYQAISVTDPAAPTHALVVFYTGFPDGYATYEVTLESGHPTTLTAYAS